MLALRWYPLLMEQILRENLYVLLLYRAHCWNSHLCHLTIQHNLQAITSAGMISTLAYEDKVAYFTNYYCGEEVPAAAQLNSHIIQVVGVKRNVS